MFIPMVRSTYFLLNIVYLLTITVKGIMTIDYALGGRHFCLKIEIAFDGK